MMSERYFRLPLGRLETNCYTVDCGGGIAAVIDPGDEPGAVEKLLEDKGLRAGAVLITHGHFDHVGAARALNEKYGCPVWRSDKDSKLPQPLAGDGFYTELYGDGDTVAVGKMEFRVIATPGHSMGSVCLVCGDLLFTGDTLFCGSCGRTDFPGGSAARMAGSLAVLAALPGNYTVLPGHGPVTDLDTERACNPFMKTAEAKK